MRDRPRRDLAGTPLENSDAAPVAAAAFLLSSAALVYLSLLVPDYIRPGWAGLFALSGVPCVVVGVLLLVRRRLSAAAAVALVFYGDVAIVLSAYASLDRSGTTAGALLSLPTLYAATFLRSRWVAVQALTAAACAWVINSLVPATTGVHVMRTAVIVVACGCPAIIVVLLRRQLGRSVITDPLTALLNRRGLVERFPAQVARARAGHVPVAVLVADLDHFKLVNDRLGHSVGDEVLQVVARALVTSAPPGSLVVRLGGEEFAVVVTGRPPDVGAVADRMRRSVAAEPQARGVTLSVGSSWSEPTGSNDGALLASLLRDADARMYEAKRSGGNRSVHPVAEAD